MTLKVWQVFHLYCHFTLPEPKYKYVVIVSVKTHLVAFMINSKINAIFPEAIACHASLPATHHPFLKHDSYLDCTTPCFFPENELTDFKGVIHESVRSQIIKTIRICEELEQKYKKTIFAQLMQH